MSLQSRANSDTFSSLTSANTFHSKINIASLSTEDIYIPSCLLTTFDNMTDSTQGANEIPAYEQDTGSTASHETATEDRGAGGNIAPAVHNVDAHIHRDAAPTRGRTTYPNILASEAAPDAHNVNDTGHATGNNEPSDRTSSTLPPPNHHIPPQTPQQANERRSRQEFLERVMQYLPANTPRVEIWDSHRREYRHPDQLPPILGGQTAEQARETTLPSIRTLTDRFDAQRQQHTLPAGHLREIPNNWVVERDLSYGHRRARLDSLRFEYDLHELDHMLRTNIHRLGIPEGVQKA